MAYILSAMIAQLFDSRACRWDEGCHSTLLGRADIHNGWPRFWPYPVYLGRYIIENLLHLHGSVQCRISGKVLNQCHDMSLYVMCITFRFVFNVKAGTETQSVTI